VSFGRNTAPGRAKKGRKIKKKWEENKGKKGGNRGKMLPYSGTKAGKRERGRGRTKIGQL